MTSARDLHAALGRALEAAEVENVALHREVERLSRENSDQCDDIAALQIEARKAGLDASARQALEMIQRYLDEGDAIDSVRILTCLRRAVDAAQAAKVAREEAA